MLRDGARTLLAQTVEAEVVEFLAKHAGDKIDDGRNRVVRHGHLPEREVRTGIGPVTVRQPRVRDRGVDANSAERIRFTPAILPPYARRSKNLEVLLPILYLKGISTGDFVPHTYVSQMEHFDLEAPADVFVGAGRKSGRHPMVYRRFDTGAEAIKHVIESVEPASLPGAVIETDKTRLDAADIRAIYESADFPLTRSLKRPRIQN